MARTTTSIEEINRLIYPGLSDEELQELKDEPAGSERVRELTEKSLRLKRESEPTDD